MSDKKLLFEVRDLTKKYPLSRKRTLTAVNKVNFNIYEGEIFGVVGESGCGKSTLGRVILQLLEATEGKIIYHGAASDRVSPKYLTDVNLKQYQDKALSLYKQAESTQDPGEAAMLKEEAEANLKAGAEFAGSHIMSASLGKYIEYLTKSESEMAKSAEEFFRGKAMSEKLESLESSGNLSDSQRQSIEASIAENKRLEEEHFKEAHVYRKKLAVDDEDILPVCDRGNTPEYKAYLRTLYTKGIDLCRLSQQEMRIIRYDLQMIFQDPAASLDPRQTIGSAISEALKLNTQLSPGAIKKRVLKLLDEVGLKPEHYDSYPHNLSGGQKQRVGIARAIANHPSFIVLDEAVSALDVSVKAQILQLLTELKKNQTTTYFFITHDLGVAKHFCDRIMVMYLGNICELAPGKELFSNCLHPYTKSLLDSVPRLRFGADKPDVKILEGEVPSPINPPAGCPFHTRCDRCMEICKKERPSYIEYSPEHFIACHLYSK